MADTTNKADVASSSWNNMSAVEKAEHLVKTGQSPDCYLIVPSEQDSNKFEKIPCHRAMLAGSPVLCNHFKQNKELLLIGHIPADVKKFVDYIYNEDIKRLSVYSVDTLKSLIHLANDFRLGHLLSNCLEVINVKLSKNVFDDCDLINLYEFSYKVQPKNTESDPDDPTLLDNVTEAIRKKAKSGTSMICSYAGVFDLDPETFYALMKLLKGCATEAVRFNMIEIYAKVDSFAYMESDGEKEVEERRKQNEKKKNYIKLMLQTINYNEMNDREFRNGPGRSKHLDKSEKYEIMAGKQMSNAFSTGW